MNILNLAIILFIFSVSPTLAVGGTITLTCPSSGEGSSPIALTLTGDGGFELAKDQTMFLPLSFDHATMEQDDSQKRLKLSCVYNSLTEKGSATKTVTLVGYAPSGSTECKVVSSVEKGKLNRLECKGGL